MEQAENNGRYSKKEVQELLSDISEQVLNADPGYMHSLLALNLLLRQSNAEEIFDDELKKQARDVWLKLKSMGLNLTDPPLLFDLPKDFYEEGHRPDAPSKARER